jgi:hypothetical protein
MSHIDNLDTGAANVGGAEQRSSAVLQRLRLIGLPSFPPPITAFEGRLQGGLIGRSLKVPVKFAPRLRRAKARGGIDPRLRGEDTLSCGVGPVVANKSHRVSNATL